MVTCGKMKTVLLSFKEKKGFVAPSLVCGLHKITVVGFLTQVSVSEISSRVSRVLRGLLKSFWEMQLSSLLAIHSFPSLVLCVLFCILQFLVPSQCKPRGGSPKSWGWHCCRPVPRAPECPFPYLSHLCALSLAETLALLFTAPELIQRKSITRF